MQKTILKYGLISGLISGLLMALVTITCAHKDFMWEYGAYIGYTSMIISMALVYFGVKHFRDQENGGQITLTRAMWIGFGIVSISCILYSLTWLVVYYNFLPNFMNEYAAHEIQKAQAAGISAEALSKKQAQFDEMKKMYSTPLGVFSITLLEPLPVGILISILSAIVLRKKQTIS